MLFRVLGASLLVGAVSASFCGDSSVPFSVEILPDGQPVLGCARPSCFGWTPSGKPASQTGSFYRINNRPDGYFRNDRPSVPEFGSNDPRYYRPQTATCEATFSSASCAPINQWVGGIAPLLNVTAFPTVLQCCALDALVESEDRGVASLHGGQMVVGGEVLSNGVQIAFDYVSDIIKIVRPDGTVQYDVAIRRFACPGLNENGKYGKDGEALAFQEANVQVNQPLPLPGQAPVAGNTLVEEVIQEEAVQLPQGAQLQPVGPPPPPPPQFVAPGAGAPVAPQFVGPAAAGAPVYAPPAYGGYSGGGYFCFTADMEVMTAKGETKRMDELEKGDLVLSLQDGEPTFFPVTFWLHRNKEQEAEFYKFDLEDGNTIKLTDKHYIYKGDCSQVGQILDADYIKSEPVFAEEVSQGDCLYTFDDEFNLREVRVMSSSVVVEKGIYAPMTSNGRIFVNNVYASCHNIVNSHTMQKTFFEHINEYRSWLASLFGSSDEETVETPSGLSTAIEMFNILIPKNLATF